MGAQVIIGGPTAPPGPSPEIEVEKGRSESNEGKHFRKAIKEDRLKQIIRMTFDIYNRYLRTTLEQDAASHAVYPAEQGRRI